MCCELIAAINVLRGIKKVIYVMCVVCSDRRDEVGTGICICTYG